MKYYLFLDSETTGTDTASDALLEIAWFITDEHYVILSKPMTFPINVEEGNTVASLSAMSQYVREMHTESGLLGDIEDGATLDYVFGELAADIETYVGPDDTLHLAGFSVHFDVDFLKANDFAGLWNEFGGRKPKIHHRQLDLSSVKLMMEDAGLTEMIGYDLNPLPHRALSDCYEALLYARRVRGFLGLAVPFPPVGADTVSAITADDAVLAELDDDVVTIDLTKYEGNL